MYIIYHELRRYYLINLQNNLMSKNVTRIFLNDKIHAIDHELRR